MPLPLHYVQAFNIRPQTPMSVYAVRPKALQNADMRAKIEKLVAAGVLQTG